MINLSYDDLLHRFYINMEGKKAYFYANISLCNNEYYTISFYNELNYSVKSDNFSLIDVLACLIDIQQFAYLSFLDYCTIHKKNIYSDYALNRYFDILFLALRIKKFLGDFDTSEIRALSENRIELIIS